MIVHAEATRHLHRTLGRIRDWGPGRRWRSTATPAVAVEDVLDLCAMVLVMTVNPGFGGQDYIATMEPKIARVRAMVEAGGYGCDVEVDGGIGPSTVAGAAAAANVLVAGSACSGTRGLEHGERAALARHHLAPLDDHVVDDAVVLGLLGREPAVALGVGPDLLDVLAGVEMRSAISSLT